MTPRTLPLPSPATTVPCLRCGWRIAPDTRSQLCHVCDAPEGPQFCHSRGGRIPDLCPGGEACTALLAREKAMPVVPTFPPQTCTICRLFAAMVGKELGQALRLMRRVLQQECACGFWLSAHSVLHPHGIPGSACAGIRQGADGLGALRGEVTP